MLTDAPPILRTDNLSRKYGEHLALNNLNLNIKPGEVFAYIGPNGSGKTTTFRILCGLLDPTSGAAYIDGKDVTGNERPDQAARRLPARQLRRLPDAARVGVLRLLRRRAQDPEEGAR
jgi:ABC-type multidrug transport system ATPase subunit